MERDPGWAKRRAGNGQHPIKVQIPVSDHGAAHHQFTMNRRQPTSEYHCFLVRLEATFPLPFPTNTSANQKVLQTKFPQVLIASSSLAQRLMES